MSDSEKVIDTPLKDESVRNEASSSGIGEEDASLPPVAMELSSMPGGGEEAASPATGGKAGTPATGGEESATPATGDVLSSEVTEAIKLVPSSSQVPDDNPSSPDTSEVDSLVLASIGSPEKKDLVVLNSDEEDILLSSPLKIKSGPKHSPIRFPSPPKSKHSPILPPSPKRDYKDCRRRLHLSESKKPEVGTLSAQAEKCEEINPKKSTVISLRKKLPEVVPVPGKKIILKRRASGSSDDPEQKPETPKKEEPRASKSTDEPSSPPKKKYKPITYP